MTESSILITLNWGFLKHTFSSVETLRDWRGLSHEWKIIMWSDRLDFRDTRSSGEWIINIAAKPLFRKEVPQTEVEK